MLLGLIVVFTFILFFQIVAVCEGGIVEFGFFFLFALNDNFGGESGIAQPTNDLLIGILSFFVPSSTIEEMKTRWSKTFEYERLLKEYKNHQLIAALPDVTHFCFLMHGLNGQSKDLNYLQAMLQYTADQYVSCRRKSSRENSLEDLKLENIIIHNIQANEGKTKDGIENGGNRMANEMVSVIQSEIQRQKNFVKEPQNKSKLSDRNVNITISVVGNSLGGLYSRYAVALLSDLFTEKEDGTYSTMLCNYTVNVVFNVFCTTATPHLGVSKNTYFPIPRGAEIAIAKMMGLTGHDLFCVSNVVKNMATTPYFLSPLSNFRRRIAYANAFHTDFPVPTQTAAFLNSKNTYPHHFVSGIFEKNDGNDVSKKKQQSFMLVAFRTKPTTDDILKQLLATQEEVSKKKSKSAETDNLFQMSLSLDALGWKKVFVDIDSNSRSPKPNAIEEKSAENSDPPKRFKRKTSKKKIEPDAQEKILQLLEREKNILESKDLITAFSLPKNKLSLPIGHNRIVAFSRSKVSHLIHKGGRPVMDGLASELIDGIFNWEQT